MIGLGAAGTNRTEIILVGGGHAHVQVMRAFGLWPQPDARLTLVTDRLSTPYSGMLPGCIAGDYGPADMHIDLVRLARATGTRLIAGVVTGIDRAGRRLHLHDRPPLAYDLLSLNVGITPDLSRIEGAEGLALPVKPIAGFLARFDALLARAMQPDGPRKLALVGGGPAGVELALAIMERLRREARSANLDPDSFELSLFSAGTLVATLNETTRRAVRRALGAASIGLHENAPIRSMEPGRITTDTGFHHECDAVFVSTDARLPDWLAHAGLPLDGKRGVALRPTLQLLDDDDIFAAGDCASIPTLRREKAGVYAVRQGPVLADNLRRRASGRALREYRPQKRFLVMLRLPGGSAVAARGKHIKLEGPLVRRWKEAIDRRFMAMFDPDTMAVMGAMPAMPEADSMRCGGCAAKVGPAPLARALARLPADPHGGTSRAERDDAAVVEVAPGHLEAQSVDQFRAFVDDPFLFGRIAANHALSDIYAMGGVPSRALAIAALPHAAARAQEEELYQLLAGARATFDPAGVALLGGHTAEAAETLLGFAVSGHLPEGTLFAKDAVRAGDVLILTKPIGVGIVLAADMRAKARAESLAAAYASMLASNGVAAAILARHGCRAATDVTGFGLGGHLAELLRTGAGATLDLGAVPLLPGALALAKAGIASTLLPANRQQMTRFAVDPVPDEATVALLFDPQTAGGLLAALPASAAVSVLAELAGAGLSAAAIGSVDERPGPIRLQGRFGG
jgi:selenide,water dikinase